MTKTRLLTTSRKSLLKRADIKKAVEEVYTVYKKKQHKPKKPVVISASGYMISDKN